ncbi:hypothetical protein CPB84DRAFT_1770539 [Gymnopilus junonius]|uniref:Uncharacterized protein n=1 Tax=Gymnopilus junonius TaxID=109634 RepID=A0A9P5NW92_GYMJU|nr:hypothetical protein CPB84DRAFT_1770539 [Gymnopilus junonius]
MSVKNQSRSDTWIYALSPVPELSQEVVHKIIVHVAAESRNWSGENLLQYTLVSRSFRPRSQLHIFSSIVIRGESLIHKEKVQLLLDILEHNSGIANYVEVRLDCTGQEYLWITEGTTFIAVLQKISSSERPLRKFVLEAYTKEDDGYETLSFVTEEPQSILDHFFPPFISPSITSLSLHRLLDVPIEVMTSCVNLTDLELLHVELIASEEEGGNQPHPLRLQRLAHRLAQPALTMLLQPIADGLDPALDLSQLKAFTTYTGGQSGLQFEHEIIDAP